MEQRVVGRSASCSRTLSNTKLTGNGGLAGSSGGTLPNSCVFVFEVCEVYEVYVLDRVSAVSGPGQRLSPMAFDDSTKKSTRAGGQSILPEHVHVVVARHTYKVEQICNLLKGEATKQLKAESLHPQQKSQRDGGRVPSMWAEGQWKVYLDTEGAIEAAIRYVDENPIKENRPPQEWPFVTPFAGFDPGWTTYH